MIYSIVTIFRRSENGRLYRNPGVLNIPFHLIYIGSYGWNIGWLFIWDALNFRVDIFLIKINFIIIIIIIKAAFGFLLALTVSLYMCIYISHKNIFHAIPILTKGNR